MSLLEDYRAELANAQHDWSLGIAQVAANVAGEKLASGRAAVPIDEYIAMWQEGVDTIPTLSPEEAEKRYNY